VIIVIEHDATNDPDSTPTVTVILKRATEFRPERVVELKDVIMRALQGLPRDVEHLSVEWVEGDGGAKD